MKIYTATSPNGTHHMFLGKWGNYPKNNPNRLFIVYKVIEAVEKYGVVSIHFDYDGRTKHQMTSYELSELLPQSYKKEISMDYRFLIKKQEVK